jgi:hypothetical protein
MDIVLSFGPMDPRIAVSLPDERPFFEVLESVKRAVEEGKQQVVNIIIEAEIAQQVPRHGTIEFDLFDDDDLLYSDGEGAWWLYARPSRLRASAIALKMICNVAHVILTVEP